MVPQILNEGGGENVALLTLDEAGRVSGCGNDYYSLLHASELSLGTKSVLQSPNVRTTEYILGSY